MGVTFLCPNKKVTSGIVSGGNARCGTMHSHELAPATRRKKLSGICSSQIPLKRRKRGGYSSGSGYSHSTHTCADAPSALAGRTFVGHGHPGTRKEIPAWALQDQRRFLCTNRVCLCIMKTRIPWCPFRYVTYYISFRKIFN